MTNPERIEKMRETARLLSEQADRLADELDPPRPKPGTVVWWRVAPESWFLGVTEKDGIRPVGNITVLWSWYYEPLEWKPARIAGPMQTIVDVPTVGEWPSWAEAMEWNFIGGPITVRNRPIVTRDEVERMEAEQ